MMEEIRKLLSFYGKYESGYQRILNNTINAFTDGE